MFFQYGEKEINYLKRKDKKLALEIERIGIIHREIMPNIFEALINSIVGQQISSAAHMTVWKRFCELVNEVTPEHILNMSDDNIQKCGMTMKKVSYIKGIATAAVNKSIDFETLAFQSDEEIIEQLVKLSGVGIWTVEMILIFSLNRMNVLSYNDLAIKRGMMELYGLKSISKELFNKYKKRYSPYASVASLYFWEISKK